MRKQNKLWLLLLTILAALALAACGAAPAEPAEEPTWEPAEDTPVPEQKPWDEGAIMELTDLLQNVVQRSQPGAAGSSLVSTELAARLLDFQGQRGLSAEEINIAAAALLSGLDEAGVSLFQEQLAGVYSAAAALYGENAADLLATAGCPVEQFLAYPWPEADGQALFAAIYQGCGWELPQE